MGDETQKTINFGDTIERGDRGWKEAQRQGEDRVTLRITLLSSVFFQAKYGAN